jgi:ferrous-iron efflux pump FieF
VSGAQTSDAELGIGVSVVAMVLTVALISYQRHVVKRTGSVAIGTDRLHYSSDLMLNGSVIAALALDQLAHLTGADAVFGVLIALWLLWGAWSASSHALDQLMDREWPEDLRARFLAATKDYPELAGLHDLRTRSSGTHNFAQFHVWVPADWTVREAHDRLDRVEEALQQRFPGTEILIHVDPEGQSDRETILSKELTEKA